MDRVWSTEDVAHADRRAYWHDAICRTFVRLDVASPVGPTFAGRVRATDLGPVRLSTIDANSMGVSRTRSAIEELDSDDLLVALHVRGLAAGAQDGRQVTLRPGGMSLFDALRPYRVDFVCNERFRHIVLQLPRAMLQQRIPGPEALTATPVDTTRGMGRLASRFLTDVAASVGQLDATQAAAVADQAVDMVALALRPRDADVDRGLPLARSAQQWILAHLSAGHVRPALVAAAHHVSVRTLYTAFERHVGLPVAEWTQQQRFERIAADLRDPTCHLTVAETGRRHGVHSASYLTRGYRARFGRTPSEDRVME